ncbi:helix-turn-helix domain-containing protein [Paraburkholderia metrosideri]|nr:hypothetical protein [Paraburkholderia metrosideri]
MDSEAFVDLSSSAVRLLLVLARQLTKDNNGHLQATYAYCKRYGFKSDNTLRPALAELIAHGLVYRTRSSGANKVWARYAVTWLPIKNRDGLFLDGFLPDAWKLFEPTEEKKAPRRNCEKHPAETARSARKMSQKLRDVGAQKLRTMN